MQATIGVEAVAQIYIGIPTTSINSMEPMPPPLLTFAMEIAMGRGGGAIFFSPRQHIFKNPGHSSRNKGGNRPDLGH